jgi:hypothetical protein
VRSPRPRYTSARFNGATSPPGDIFATEAVDVGPERGFQLEEVEVAVGLTARFRADGFDRRCVPRGAREGRGQAVRVTGAESEDDIDVVGETG